MKIRLDAIIAEIAITLDISLLRDDRNFTALPRFNRMHLIMGHLSSLNIARAERTRGRKVLRWRLSHRFESKLGVKHHRIPDVLERIERPIAISTLADEFSEFLQANVEKAEEAASYVLRRFAMYESGLLKYRGKRDGICQFDRSSRHIG